MEAAEDKIVEWHHWLTGHEFEQTLGDGERQGHLACCSPWGRRELDMTEWLSNNNLQKQSHSEMLGWTQFNSNQMSSSPFHQ